MLLFANNNSTCGMFPHFYSSNGAKKTATIIIIIIQSLGTTFTQALSQAQQSINITWMNKGQKIFGHTWGVINVPTRSDRK